MPGDKYDRVHYWTERFNRNSQKMGKTKKAWVITGAISGGCCCCGLFLVILMASLPISVWSPLGRLFGNCKGLAFKDEHYEIPHEHLMSVSVPSTARSRVMKKQNPDWSVQNTTGTTTKLRRKLKIGFDKDSFDKDGFNKDGFDKDGFNKDGFDKDGFDKNGFDKDGYNKDGFDIFGKHRNEGDKDGKDKNGSGKDSSGNKGLGKAFGFDKDSFDKNGFNIYGFDINGFDKNGFDINGFDKNGFDKNGFDKNGFDINGFDINGFDVNGFDKNGFDKDGKNKDGKYNKNEEGSDNDGTDKDGKNKDEVYEYGKKEKGPHGPSDETNKNEDRSTAMQILYEVDQNDTSCPDYVDFYLGKGHRYDADLYRRGGAQVPGAHFHKDGSFHNHPHDLNDLLRHLDKESKTKTTATQDNTVQTLKEPDQEGQSEKPKQFIQLYPEQQNKVDLFKPIHFKTQPFKNGGQNLPEVEVIYNPHPEESNSDDSTTPGEESDDSNPTSPEESISRTEETDDSEVSRQTSSAVDTNQETDSVDAQDFNLEVLQEPSDPSPTERNVKITVLGIFSSTGKPDQKSEFDPSQMVDK